MNQPSHSVPPAGPLADADAGLDPRPIDRAQHQAVVAENHSLQANMALLERELADRLAELGRVRGVLGEAQGATATARADLELERSAAKPMAGTAPWAKAVDDTWFASRHRRESERRGTDHGETLAEALQGHLATCAELLKDFPATPPGADQAGDVVARLRTLLAQRVRDHGWISELQVRGAAVQAERDEARAAADSELQRTIVLESRGEELERRCAELQKRSDELTAQLGERTSLVTLPDAGTEAELAEVRDRLAEAGARLEDAGRARVRGEQELAVAASARAAAEVRAEAVAAQLAQVESRLKEVHVQLGDQRRTTDLARLASVEAETLRGEVDGLRRLLAEREQVLAGERAQHHRERDKNRADTAVRLEAIKRVEQALLSLRDQLDDKERQLSAAQAELGEARTEVEVLRARGPQTRELVVVREVPEAANGRSAEVEALASELAAARAATAAAGAARETAGRGQRLAEAERDGLRAQQADAVRLGQEVALLRAALAASEAQAAQAAAARDAAQARLAEATAGAAAERVAATAASAGRDGAAAEQLVALRAELDAAQAARSQALAAQAGAEAARRLAEAELAGARAHQADGVALQQERDRLLAALREAERTAGAAAADARLAEVVSGIEQLKSRPDPVIPAHQPTDLSPVQQELARLAEEIGRLAARPQPEPPAPADLSPVHQGLERLSGEVAQLAARPQPEPPAPVDLGPVHQGLDRLSGEVAQLAARPQPEPPAPVDLEPLSRQLDELRSAMAQAAPPVPAASTLDYAPVGEPTPMAKEGEHTSAPAGSIMDEPPADEPTLEQQRALAAEAEATAGIPEEPMAHSWSTTTVTTGDGGQGTEEGVAWQSQRGSTAGAGEPAMAWDAQPAAAEQVAEPVAFVPRTDPDATAPAHHLADPYFSDDQGIPDEAPQG